MFVISVALTLALSLNLYQNLFLRFLDFQMGRRFWYKIQGKATGKTDLAGNIFKLQYPVKELCI